MEWLRCEDSSNLFKTPKSVQCCQTGKLKSLINLYYLRNFEIIYRVSVISRRPSLPSLPTAGQGKGRGKEELYQLLNPLFWCIYSNLRGTLTFFVCIWMQRCSYSRTYMWATVFCHAWPILLFALVLVVIPLLSWIRIKKSSIFCDNFTKKFLFSRQTFPNDFLVIHSKVSRQNWPCTVTFGQIILFLFESHHFQTYFLYIIRYSRPNISRPSATPQPPHPKIWRVATPNTSGLTPLERNDLSD